MAQLIQHLSPTSPVGALSITGSSQLCLCAAQINGSHSPKGGVVYHASCTPTLLSPVTRPDGAHLGATQLGPHPRDLDRRVVRKVIVEVGNVSRLLQVRCTASLYLLDARAPVLQFAQSYTLSTSYALKHFFATTQSPCMTCTTSFHLPPTLASLRACYLVCADHPPVYHRTRFPTPACSPAPRAAFPQTRPQ
jgi:hypothetical protein